MCTTVVLYLCVFVSTCVCLCYANYVARVGVYDVILFICVTMCAFVLC